MNAVIYCRVSSRDQVDGTSLESQEAACREYAHGHRLNVARVFIEQGESAKFADRTQLLALLDFVRSKTNHVSVLLVWKVDRFARNVEDHFAIKAALRKLGISVVSVTEPIQADPNGKLLETILAGFAQFDNDVRAIRCTQGMQQRLREGIYPWKPPLGYVSPKIGKKVQPDRPDPQSFHLIQKGWKLFLTGAYRQSDVLALLRRWGVTGFRGGLLNAQVLTETLRNPYYAGVLRDPWTGTEFTGRHVPMVSRDEFAATQAMLNHRTGPRMYRRAHEAFPLRSLVRCPSCQRYMTGYFSRGRNGTRYPYYRCFNRTCSTRTHSYLATTLHAEFETYLAKMSVSEALVRPLLAELRTTLSDEHGASTAIGLAAVAARRRVEQQVQELISLRTMQAISHQEFLKQRQELDESLAALPSPETSAQYEVSDDNAKVLIRSLTDLPTLWRHLPPEERRAFGILLLPSGYVHDRIRNAEMGLLISILGTSEKQESGLVELVKRNSKLLMADIRKLLAVSRSVRPKRREQLKAA